MEQRPEQEMNTGRRPQLLHAIQPRMPICYLQQPHKIGQMGAISYI